MCMMTFLFTALPHPGQAIYHPLSQGNTIIQSIFDVERDFRTVFLFDNNGTNMIDSVTVSSTNVLPLGPSDEEGIQIDTHNYTYSCRNALTISGVSVWCITSLHNTRGLLHNMHGLLHNMFGLK